MKRLIEPRLLRGSAIARITDLSRAGDRLDLAGRSRHESTDNEGEESAAFHGDTFHLHMTTPRGFAQKKVSGTLKRSRLPHLLRLESSRHLFLGKATPRRIVPASSPPSQSRTRRQHGFSLHRLPE